MIRDVEVIPDRNLAAQIDGKFWYIVGKNWTAKKHNKLKKKIQKREK